MLLVCQVTAHGERTGKSMHLFRIELLAPVPRHMFREAVDCEAAIDGCFNDIFECSSGVATKLACVARPDCCQR